MKVIVKAFCQDGGSYFDGLDCQDEFVEYYDNAPECLGYGYMFFEYNKEEDKLYVFTEYETTRKLTKTEEKDLIDYTQGQWSDGIGEGFEQRIFEEGTNDWIGEFDEEDDAIYYPSAWHPGQKAELYYVEKKQEN